MEQQKGLMKAGMNLPGIMQNAFDSIEGMNTIAQLLLDSKTLPFHYYEKLPDGKPDFSKGLTHKVAAVLIKGYDLGLKPMTALQSIIPINGLLSLKVDLMKSMIFGSGVMESWEEVERGEVESGNYTVIVTSKRKDNGVKLSRSFSIEEAKRAGLWITPDMIRGQDGWRHKASAWWKYGSRMIGIRAAGFLCRDLYGDVIDNTISYEEAVDYQQDQTTVLDTGTAKIIIPDKNFSQERSQSITNRANDAIDKKMSNNGFSPSRDFEKQVPPELNKRPQTPEESHNSLSVSLNGKEETIPVLSEKQMIDMDAKDLMAIIDMDDEMRQAIEFVDGKNTNKKLRTIILAKIDGTIKDLLPQEQPDNAGQDDPSYYETPPMEENNEQDDGAMDNDYQESPERNDLPWENDNEENEPQAETVGDTEGLEGNKFNIEIPELVDGKRSFEQVKNLFEELDNVAGVNNQVFVSLVTTKFPQLQHYRTKEDFCYKGTVEDINMLLNSI